MSVPQRRHRLFEARRAVDDDHAPAFAIRAGRSSSERTPAPPRLPARCSSIASMQSSGRSARTPRSPRSNEIEVRPDLSNAGHARDCGRRGSAARSAASASERAFQASQSPYRLAPDARALDVLRCRDQSRQANGVAIAASHAAGVGPCDDKPRPIIGVGGPGAATGHGAQANRPLARLARPRRSTERVARRSACLPRTCPSASADRAVAHADNRRLPLNFTRLAPTIARTRQRLGKFLLQTIVLDKPRA